MMQTYKIGVGIVALMLTMIVLGMAVVREPSRLRQFAHVAQGKSVERGTTLYFEHCADCHGMHGEAWDCYDDAGEQIACFGIPLNNQRLVCGNNPDRLKDVGWIGTKEQYISRVIAGGCGEAMVAWSDQFGGMLNNREIEDLTQYILAYENEDLCNLPPIPCFGCWEGSYEEFRNDPLLRTGDLVRGKELFDVTYGCVGCHGGDDSDASWAGTGPWLGDIKENAPLRDPTVSTEQYIYESILDPSAIVVDGYANGIMPQNFAQRMWLSNETRQDMVDIIAYLMNQ